MDTCKCCTVQRVYCNDCEFYQEPSVYTHFTLYERCCLKYAEEVHFPTHKSKRLGDVSILNEYNQCEGYSYKPKPKPGSYEVVVAADDPAVAMSIGKALLISAFIMLMGGLGSVWLL